MTFLTLMSIFRIIRNLVFMFLQYYCGNENIFFDLKHAQCSETYEKISFGLFQFNSNFFWINEPDPETSTKSSREHLGLSFNPKAFKLKYISVSLYILSLKKLLMYSHLMYNSVPISSHIQVTKTTFKQLYNLKKTEKNIKKFS